jgi:hypothetical protein
MATLEKTIKDHNVSIYTLHFPEEATPHSSKGLLTYLVYACIYTIKKTQTLLRLMDSGGNITRL